eukprot:5795318-Amphidinium_carterae.1
MGWILGADWFCDSKVQARKTPGMKQPGMISCSLVLLFCCFFLVGGILGDYGVYRYETPDKLEPPKSPQN